MRISIVTLSFNQRAYLLEAMDSVLSQGYSDLEYIIVDPGSTDGSRELIESYSDRLAQIIFEPDRGAADGLNKGFSRATGEVFGFLNADDVLFPGSLQLVADFFEKHPECDLALGDGYKIDGAGRRGRHYRARDFTAKRFILWWNSMVAAIRLFPGRSVSSLSEVQFREPHVLGRRIVCQYRKPGSKHRVHSTET